ncbi:putative membrane protein YfcA [Rhodoligotrophos appendicifer]|uniref:sulfite exporter TauE/SafE family protein n=1 Tax=Rhodoligotrophos appendicifer TaxID=987056 RepID=UPI0011851D34|nr:sulfite exporter TauE/SafE family protein [Rhodoligotrophos appendicifer]
MDFTWIELAVIIACLSAAGALTGLLAGVFGVGGGAVVVPILYEFFRMLGMPEDIRMPFCVGTSLAVIIPTSIQSFRTHFAHKAVDSSILRIWAVPAVLGVIAGGIIARYAPQEVFKGVFTVVAALSAFRLLFGKESWRLASEMPGRAVMRLYGFVIGILSALMGIGGGQLSSMFMTVYGRSIHQAVATSSGLGILISIPGALGYIYAGWPRAAQYPELAMIQPPFALGYISLIGVALLVPASIVTAPIGARLAHRLAKRRLELAFGLFLLLVSARFLVSFW